jgi:Family of unknown function (DUF6328)
MSPHKKTKIALDENRMSILGVQILFGFQLQAPFQKQFETLPQASRYASLAAFGLLSVAVALLIAPSAYHRIVVRHGSAEGAIRHGITWLIDVALLLLALAIGIDLYLVGDRIIGGVAGPILGVAFCLVALVFWYGIEAVSLTKRIKPVPTDNGDALKLEDRIDFALTEARVVLPGVQALLGFQLAVVLTEEFGRLPPSAALTHLVALAAVAISAVLLIAPASHHRIVFGGEEAEEFLPIAGAYLLAATVFLAVGMAADSYVIVAKVLNSQIWGVMAGVIVASLCLSLWHVVPLIARKNA